MSHAPSTAIYQPSETGEGYVAAAFSPDGKIQARRSFGTPEAAEAFLQAFVQEKAGEDNARDVRNAHADLRDRRAGVIRSAKDESKRRHLGVYGGRSQP